MLSFCLDTVSPFVSDKTSRFCPFTSTSGLGSRQKRLTWFWLKPRGAVQLHLIYHHYIYDGELIASAFQISGHISKTQGQLASQHRQDGSTMWNSHRLLVVGRFCKCAIYVWTHEFYCHCDHENKVFVWPRHSPAHNPPIKKITSTLVFLGNNRITAY